MKINKTIWIFGILVLALSWTAADPAMAASLTLTLQHLSLDNVDDVAGRWQHEGGQVFCPNGNKPIANYAAHRRVTFSGTSPQNTAMLTLTLFFLGGNPPQNITLQGSHDFNSGKYIGSVSATSHGFRHVRGQTFAGNAAADTLTIRRLGDRVVNPCGS